MKVLDCPPQIAARLRIEEGEFVVSRHQQRYIDDTVWSLQTSYYPMKWVEKGAARLLVPKDIPEGAVEYLGSTIGLTQSSYRDLLWARQPNDTEKDALQPDDQPPGHRGLPDILRRGRHPDPRHRHGLPR